MKAFQFAPGLDLRLIDHEGDPWFVAKDVCEVLEVHTRDVRKVLDADEVSEISVDSVHLTRGGRGRPPRTPISESGLYSLILKSRKPEAKAFKRWVTAEVLPSIRKNGGHMAPAVAKLAVESPAEFMARALVMANETIAGLQKAVRLSCSFDAQSPQFLQFQVAILTHTEERPSCVFQMARVARKIGAAMSRTQRLRNRVRSLQDKFSALATVFAQCEIKGLNSS